MNLTLPSLNHRLQTWLSFEVEAKDMAHLHGHRRMDITNEETFINKKIAERSGRDVFNYRGGSSPAMA